VAVHPATSHAPLLSVGTRNNKETTDSHFSVSTKKGRGLEGKKRKKISQNRESSFFSTGDVSASTSPQIIHRNTFCTLAASHFLEGEFLVFSLLLSYGF